MNYTSDFPCGRLVSFHPAMKPAFLRRFAAFDVETTGLGRNKDRIIEIGCVLFENGQEVRRFQTLVNPGRPIPQAASRINHIYDDMVAEAPNEVQALLQLKQFLETSFPGEILLCAHNAPFDFAFLDNALKRNSIPLQFTMMDTLKPYRSCLPYLHSHKQEVVAASFGIQNENAHRAADDACVCGQILCRTLSEGLLDGYMQNF